MDSDSPNSGSLDELLSLLGETPEGPEPYVTRAPGGSIGESGAFGGKETACLSGMEIAQLATGSIDDGRAADLLEHVSCCGICARHLQEAKQDLGRELSSEEEAVLANLRSSRAEWQSTLVARARRPDRRQVWNWVSAAAAAAVVLLGIGGFWLMHGRGPERLLEQAYLEGRPFEYRLDLPGYSEVRQERGGSSARPAALIKAEAKLVDLRQEGANDASSLRLMGIGDLLQGDADAASGNLTRALAAAPANDAALRAKLMTELAVAKAVQGQKDGQPSEYGAALNYLSEVIHADPRNAAAIFDSAMVFEQLRQYREAGDYWARYLQLDSGSRWSEIAKQHLSEVESKKNNGPLR